jgi:hypothetical protein
MLALFAGFSLTAGASHAQPAPDRACGGLAGLACPKGDYCRIAPPQAPDKMGVCRPRPQICAMNYAPVCGVNHRTYSNACMAAAAGVNVAHAGKCEIEAPGREAGTPRP